MNYLHKFFQFSPEKSRASNRLMKHTSKSARQITKSGDVYELEQGVVVDNENVLITNVTVHVVNPDEEAGILMRYIFAFNSIKIATLVEWGVSIKMRIFQLMC